MATLTSRHVVLDTTVFDAANFSYRSAPLKALADLVSTARVKVYLSDITIREVKDHITRAVADTLPAQQQFENKARILRNSTISSIRARFGKLDLKSLEGELVSQFEEFCMKAKVIKLPLGGVDMGAVFDAYFGKKPPFGEGKNKAEFPDAFLVAAARKWTEEHDLSLYVVSADKRLREACDGTKLLPLDKLSTFLDLVAREDEARAQVIHEKARERFSEVADVVQKQFESQGFMLEDKEGDVNEVTVTSVELEDINILSFRERSAMVELQVSLQFTANVSYEDLDNAVYDKEEGRYLFVDTLEETVEAEETVTVTATILMTPRDPKKFKFDRVKISGPETYWIEVDNGWPYR